VRRTLTAAPRAVRIVCLAALVLAAFSLTNLVYHVVASERAALFRRRALDSRNPIERGGGTNRSPHVFHQHDHAQLLAALAQVESTGNRWRAPLALAAYLESLRGVQTRLERCGHVPDDRCSYAEAARYCIRGTLS